MTTYDEIKFHIKTTIERTQVKNNKIYHGNVPNQSIADIASLVLNYNNM
jgi:hypothetical protein